MSADLQSFGWSFREFLVLYLTAWRRSRAPWLWLVFVGAWGWMDWELRPADSAWWTNWLSLTAMVGFIAGYDAYLRLREHGSLRYLLLQGASPAAASLGFLAGGAVLVGGALVAFALYLIVLAGAPLGLEVVGICAVLWGASLGFIAYAQLGSLLLPRDTVAVLGLLVVIFGTGPWDRWFDSGAPAALRWLAQGTALALPAAHRVGQVLESPGSDALPLLLVFAQAAAAAAAIAWVLGRGFLLARSGDE